MKKHSKAYTIVHVLAVVMGGMFAVAMIAAVIRPKGGFPAPPNVSQTSGWQDGGKISSIEFVRTESVDPTTVIRTDKGYVFVKAYSGGVSARIGSSVTFKGKTLVLEDGTRVPID